MANSAGGAGGTLGTASGVKSWLVSTAARTGGTTSSAIVAVAAGGGTGSGRGRNSTTLLGRKSGASAARDMDS
ncbi:MAG: hypothetical protein HC918_08665 [Oscillatoriales cyanobacterium SM2_1_8]|nr:hypothetical protein [Oscillatoriales cyanobacterium SM2_1_8]